MDLLIGVLLAQTVAQPPPAPTQPPEPKAARADTGTLLPLRDVVIAGIEHNLTLRSARASTLSVETGIRSARSAFDPFLQLSPTFSHGDRRTLVQPGLTLSGVEENTLLSGGIDGATPLSTTYSVLFNGTRLRQDPAFLPPGTFTPNTNTALTFTVGQPLLRGFGPGIAKAPVRQAELTSSSAWARLDRLTQQVIFDVESSYWNLGLAAAFERVARDSYERARELLSRNERMLGLSLISEVDAITSRRGVQQRLTTLTEATRQRKDAAERLIFLAYGEEAVAHLAPELDYATEAPPEGPPPVPDVAILEDAAISARSDLRAARFDVQFNEVAKRVAGNALLPDARLSASYAASTLNAATFQLFDVRRLGDLEANDWRVGVNVSYPLWNRAARAANARAKYDLEASLLAVASAEQAVRSDVRSAVRAISANVERLEQARLSLEYSRQQYDAGQKQLRLGLLDSFRLLQMEEEVANAELTFDQTRYDLALAITSFELALGTGPRKYGLATMNRTP